MKIRDASLDDIPAILALMAKLKQESPVYRGKTSDILKQKAVLRTVITSGFASVVEDLSGVMLGVIEESPWFVEHKAEEILLYVLPEYRGTRRAVDLVRRFEKWAAAHNCAHIVVGVATGINPGSALRFYRKMGYKPGGESLVKEL